MKRIASLFIALAMLASLFACAENASDAETDSASETSAPSSATEDTTAETPEAKIAALYGDKDYGGREFRILTPDPGGHFYDQLDADLNEVYYEEYNGEIMNDAIVDRNRRTEELLGIKIVPVWGGKDTGVITTTIKNAVAADSNDFDAVINRMDFLGTSMQNGSLINLRSISTMDVTHEWWDKNIVENFTVLGDRLYWISGDINIVDDYAVEVIFFNKRLCDDHNLDYPYNSVLDGTWTIDKFYDMCTVVKTDLDGNGKYVVGKDIVGHQENNDLIKHWIYAMGEKSIEIAADGTLQLNTLSERQINVIDKLYSLMVEGEMTYPGGSDGGITTFKNGYALFQGIMLGNINGLRDMEDDFGIVPMPKYDEQQPRYGEYISNGWTTAYAVPLTNNDRDFTGVCLETMCAYSTNTVKAALYDVLLASKLIRDKETITMLDIILASKTYDWAVDFTWGSTFASAYNNVYDTKTNNYVSSAEKVSKAQIKQLEKLIETIRNLEN